MTITETIREAVLRERDAVVAFLRKGESDIASAYERDKNIMTGDELHEEAGKRGVLATAAAEIEAGEHLR